MRKLKYELRGRPWIWSMVVGPMVDATGHRISYPNEYFGRRQKKRDIYRMHNQLRTAFIITTNLLLLSINYKVTIFVRKKSEFKTTRRGDDMLQKFTFIILVYQIYIELYLFKYHIKCNRNVFIYVGLAETLYKHFWKIGENFSKTLYYITDAVGLKNIS